MVTRGGRLLLPDEVEDVLDDVRPVPSLSALYPPSDTGPFCHALTPTFLDPPSHTRFRRHLIEDWGIKSAVHVLSNQTAVLAIELLREARAIGTVEFMGSVAGKLSAGTLAAFFGDTPEAWVEATMQQGWGRQLRDDKRLELGWFQEHIWDLLCASRRSPRDNAMSRMTQHDPLEQGLRVGEITTLVLQMAVVPNESVIRLLGALARRLAQNSKLRARLRNDARAMTDVIHALLYSSPPLRGVFRRTDRACSANGMRFPQEHGLFVDIKRSNRTRDTATSHLTADAPLIRPRDYLTFGTGIHRCPGAPLAIMQASVLARVLCDLPSLRMADDGIKDEPNGPLEGPAELWLELCG
jgi:cytochrome P450